MKRQLIISVILAMAMLAGVCSAQAAGAHSQGMRHGVEGMKDDGEMHEMGDGGHHMWRLLMGLGLDDKQKAEIKEIRYRVKKEMIDKRATEQHARLDLKELLDKEPVDMKAVEAKVKQIEAGKTEIYLSFIRAREEVKSKLTDEQRKKFKEMLEMGPMMGHPMGGER